MRVTEFVLFGCCLTTAVSNVLCSDDDDDDDDDEDDVLQNRVRCSRPFVPNGHFLDPRSEFMPNSTVFVSCDVKFHLRHGLEHKLICDLNGEWIGSSNETPQCIESGCHPLPPVTNSIVSYDGPKTASGDLNEEGTTARYICMGTEFDKEPVTMRCFRGTWLGVTKINCGQKVSQCGPPKNVPNAEIVFRNQSENDSYPIGIVVFYRCVKGYVTKSVTSSSLQCMPNGQWWPPLRKLPFCERPVVLKCPPPPSIPFGYILNNRTRNTLFSTVTYACNSNYHLEGPPRKTCQSTTHEWQPITNPRCIPIDGSINNYILNKNVLTIVLCLTCCFFLIIVLAIKSPRKFRGGTSNTANSSIAGGAHQGRSSWATGLFSKKKNRRTEWETIEIEPSSRMERFAFEDEFSRQLGESSSSPLCDNPPSYEEVLSGQQNGGSPPPPYRDVVISGPPPSISYSD